MAATQPDFRDQPSPGLSISLSSNNPFRNRAASPLPKSPSSPFDDLNSAQPSSSRPASNNPFLDTTQTSQASQKLIPDLDSPTDTMAEKNDTTSATAEELFAGLSFDDKDKKPEKKGPPPQRPPPMNRPPPPGGENRPPAGRRGPPPPHRPSRSQEEALRARRPRPNGDGPNSPPRRTGGPRPRRNSDSSLAERPLTDEEKKARERRRRERDERDGRKRRDGKKPRSHRDMDLIDKLDATSIYGTGIFHHAGPYDAVIAGRNSATASKRPAPMEAFAKDSANMSMGGSGPLNARADHATFMGNGTDEAFNDYAAGMPGSGPKKEPAMFDPHRRSSVIYGDSTEGLGTTTFLEGTPAARAAVQKAEQEDAMRNTDGGLQRKKSLAQRIRGMNRPPRGEYGPSGRLTNPDGAYRDHASSVSMSSSRNEANPFFAEYEPSKDGEDKITVRETNEDIPPTPPLPGNLERRATTDALGGFEPSKKSGGGLLGRMKSLKGGPRRPSDKDQGYA